MNINKIDVRLDYRSLFEETFFEFINMTDSDFYSETILPSWKVNNIISHLASNALIKSSEINKMTENRDKTKISFESLSKIIDDNNEKWVNLLNDINRITLLEFYNFTYNNLLNKFDEVEDLDTPAVHDVMWYSDDISPWWLDIAREYSELWIHTAQIGKSLNINIPFEEKYLNLFYKICLLALNRTYNNIKEEIILKIVISERIYIFNNRKGFTNYDKNQKYDTEIKIVDDIAWKLFSGLKLSLEELKNVSINGNQELGKKFFEIESVMVKAI